MQVLLTRAMWTVVALGMALHASAQEAPRKASTILANAIVWKNDNTKELLDSGAFSGTDLAAVANNMDRVPWGIQSNNKRLCAAEVLTATPARIELKVGETFPIQNLILSSTAFGDFYFDKPLIRSWQFVASNAKFEKQDMALHALQPGEATFTVLSLCKAKGLTSKPATVTVQVVVEQAR